FAPVVPALRSDDLVHLAVQINRAGINAPWPAEKSFHARLASDLAVGENITKRHVHRRGGGGQITITQRMDFAFLEPRRRRAENKIHVTGDVAILKILPATVDEDGVLPAEEA